MDIIPEKKINFAFNVPDRTVFENGIIHIPGTGIIGNHASVIPGIRAVSLIIGEGVSVSGIVETEEDLHADIWCRFRNDVTVRRNASLGEFTSVSGKIIVLGDLDIGKEVKLDGGFETHGWVVVRNPLPIMMYLFIYIRALMGIGKTSEEIDKALDDLFEDDGNDDEQIEIDLMDLEGSDEMFLLPIGSRISENAVSVPDEAVIGKNCIICSDLYASKIIVDEETEIDGYVRSGGDICLKENVTVLGDIRAAGRLLIGKGCRVTGDVTAKKVYLHESASVEGNIVTSGGAKAVSDETAGEIISDIVSGRKDGAKKTGYGQGRTETEKAGKTAFGKTGSGKSASGKSGTGKSGSGTKTKKENKKEAAAPLISEIGITPYDPYRKTGIRHLRKVGQLKTSGNFSGKASSKTHRTRRMRKNRKQIV